MYLFLTTPKFLSLHNFPISAYHLLRKQFSLISSNCTLAALTLRRYPSLFDCVSFAAYMRAASTAVKSLQNHPLWTSVRREEGSTLDASRGSKIKTSRERTVKIDFLLDIKSRTSTPPLSRFVFAARFSFRPNIPTLSRAVHSFYPTR